MSREFFFVSLMKTKTDVGCSSARLDMSLLVPNDLKVWKGTIVIHLDWAATPHPLNEE